MGNVAVSTAARGENREITSIYISIYLYALTRFPLSRANIQKVQSQVPNAGFHATLAAFIPRLRPSLEVPLGVWELLHIMRW
jgi:hypothetical protein